MTIPERETASKTPRDPPVVPGVSKPKTVAATTATTAKKRKTAKIPKTVATEKPRTSDDIVGHDESEKSAKTDERREEEVAPARVVEPEEEVVPERVVEREENDDASLSRDRGNDAKGEIVEIDDVEVPVSDAKATKGKGLSREFVSRMYDEYVARVE